MRIVTKSEITEYPLLSRGKVRDIYEIDADSLLIVTTDRMSAFDVIMDDPIPFKGVILNQITLFWMERFKDLVPNHLLTADVREYPAPLRPRADELEGRSVIVRRARPLPVECIIRGHITGSGWKDYKASGSVCGHVLPNGLQESSMLPAPLFTPSTKAELGEHDENITLEQAKGIIGQKVFEQVRDLSLAIFEQGRDFAQEKGIIIADTKFEFGLDKNGDLMLIDEVLTPDSSRFWPVAGYEPGRSQPSFDKQYLRDWLETQTWDKKPPPPALPSEVVERTGAKYLEAYETLTGERLSFQG